MEFILVFYLIEDLVTKKAILSGDVIKVGLLFAQRSVGTNL